MVKQSGDFKSSSILVNKQRKPVSRLLLCTFLASGLLLSGAQSVYADDDEGGLLSNMFSKENISTGAGALLGGLLGSQIGDGNGQLVMTAIGAAVGGYLMAMTLITMRRKTQKLVNVKKVT